MNESLTRYVKLRVAHASGMPGTFSPLPRVSDPDMQHGTCVTHVAWCMLGALTSSFLWSRWRRKRFRHSWRMRNPRFCISGKRTMPQKLTNVKSTLLQIKAWCHQATRHFLSQCWPSHMTQYGVKMPQWGNSIRYYLDDISNDNCSINKSRKRKSSDFIFFL